MIKPIVRSLLGPGSLVFVSLMFATGCSTTSSSIADVNAVVPADDALNSTLWALTSAEYDATVLSLYGAAEGALVKGLADRGWTALIEQRDQQGYSDLPPAVVLDVDETVLDNGAYQAQLILRNTSFAQDSWQNWVNEERARPIPGALEFCRHAASMGITVIYLTNRRAPLEPATRQNLIDLGFPVDPAFDVVLTRGERPEWTAGEKSGRRRYVAEHFRVLALLGDNLGDFVEVDELDVSQRDYEVAATRAMWGSKWFMLPNPQYGSWESVLFNSRYDLSTGERRGLKRAHLDEIL